MPTCWWCEGQGYLAVNTSVRVPDGKGGHTRRITFDPKQKCEWCNGTGVVTQGQVDAKAFGDEIRSWRRENSMLCGEMAQRIGVRSSQLSRCELGRVPFPATMKRDIEELMEGER